MPTKAPAHITDLEGLAWRLKQRRLALGLSQRDVAFPGCTAVYVCRLEHADRYPSLQVVGELARRLETSPHWLLTGAQDPQERLAELVRELVVEARSGAEIPEALLDEVEALL